MLLVTCANVANLILSRSVARQRDIGVRAALGAGRLRLFQVLLGEALILATVGGRARTIARVLGGCARYRPCSPPAFRASPPSRSTGASSPSRRAGARQRGARSRSCRSPPDFGAICTICCATDPPRATGGRRQHRLQGTLVVTSVAFAFILLVCAGLFVRSFSNLVRSHRALARPTC